MNRQYREFYEDLIAEVKAYARKNHKSFRKVLPRFVGYDHINEMVHEGLIPSGNYGGIEVK